MRTPSFVIVLAVAALFPVVAMSQSLAEVAKMEEARRKTVTGVAKVYTNDNLTHSRDGIALEPAAPAGSSAAGTASSATTAGSPAVAAKPTDDGTKDEQFWKKRFAAAQQLITRNKVLLLALEARVNALNADFVNRDDPYQRNVIQDNLKTAMAELERVKQEIASGTKALNDIQDEARKANVPPGWLR